MRFAITTMFVFTTITLACNPGGYACGDNGITVCDYTGAARVSTHEDGSCLLSCRQR